MNQFHFWLVPIEVAIIKFPSIEMVKFMANECKLKMQFNIVEFWQRKEKHKNKFRATNNFQCSFSILFFLFNLICMCLIIMIFHKSTIDAYSFSTNMENSCLKFVWYFHNFSLHFSIKVHFQLSIYWVKASYLFSYDECKNFANEIDLTKRNNFS